MPRPTLEKPMPAMYWATAIFSRAVASLFTESRRYLAIILMAVMWSMSVRSQAPLVMYPSMAWVRASMPVAAHRPLGMDMTMSGSMMETTGMSWGSTQTNLRCFSTSVIT